MENAIIGRVLTEATIESLKDLWAVEQGRPPVANTDRQPRARRRAHLRTILMWTRQCRNMIALFDLSLGKKPQAGGAFSRRPDRSQNDGST